MSTPSPATVSPKPNMSAPVPIACLTPTLTVHEPSNAAETPPLAIMIAIGHVVASRDQSDEQDATTPPSLANWAEIELQP